jgi:hypothetical protein
MTLQRRPEFPWLAAQGSVQSSSRQDAGVGPKNLVDLSTTDGRYRDRDFAS